MTANAKASKIDRDMSSKRSSTLISTFYSERASSELEPQDARFYQEVAHTLGAPAAQPEWHDPKTNTWLRPFHMVSRGQRDTTVVQLAFNESGHVGDAWDIMRDRLASIISKLDMHDVIGYSLIYQAVTPAGNDSKSSMREWLPAARRPGSVRILEPLAYSVVPGGDIWLLDIPLDGDGLEAAMVYIALGPAEMERTLLEGYLFGPGAILLRPDLIAHKGYWHLRGYRIGNEGNQLECSQRALQTSVNALLEGSEEQVAEISHTNEVALGYKRLNGVAQRLIQAKTSLVKQAYNFDESSEISGMNGVLAHHRRALNLAMRELELIVESVNSTLDTAREAINSAQLQTVREQERIQQEAELANEQRHNEFLRRIEFVGVTFAILQLLDQRMVARILITTHGWMPSQLGAISSIEDIFDPWFLLGARIVLTASALYLIALAWILWTMLYPSMRRHGAIGVGRPARKGPETSRVRIYDRMATLLE